VSAGPPDGGLVACWRHVKAAVSDPRLAASDVACLVMILDRLNDAGTAWPSLARIAADAAVNRTTAVRSIKRLVDLGYLERESGTRTTSNRYRLGRCAAAPRCSDAPRCEDAPGVGAAMRLQVGAATRLEPASLNLPNEPTKEARARTPSGRALTFDEWLTQAADSGEADRTAEQLLAYMEKAGIPGEFADLVIPWAERKFADDPKRQKSWPRTLQNYVRQAWHGLWAPSRDGGFYLTTAGVQLQRELAADAGRPYVPTTQQHAPSKQLQGIASILGVSARDLIDSPPPARTQNLLEHPSTRKT
jgi:hypothetical protein